MRFFNSILTSEVVDSPPLLITRLCSAKLAICLSKNTPKDLPLSMPKVSVELLINNEANDINCWSLFRALCGRALAIEFPL